MGNGSVSGAALVIRSPAAALRDAARRIEAATGSDESHLEAELLLCHRLGVSREILYTRLNDPLDESLTQAFVNLIARRCNHEPTAYTIGRREFFGLKFEVTPAALIPRPETETLVEAVVSFARGSESGRAGPPIRIADVGAGCGNIAVSVAHALPAARVVATDLSPEALALAARNAQKHLAADSIEFRHGDLLSPLTEPVDVIAANLPYVRTADWKALPPEIRNWEPRSALDGGPDGLRIIDRLLREAPAYLNPGGALFAEIGDDQATAVTVIAREAFPDADIEVKQDRAARDRVLVVRTRD
jgi:release factor glutamine methyltransferase